MVELPGDKATLIAVTGDAFKSSHLERMLAPRSLTTSYKLYWMRGIFDEVIAGNEQIPLRRLAARMVSKAWYPVTYFRLNLGKGDRIAETAAQARGACGLGDDASEEEIVEALLVSEDELLSRGLQDRCRYVQSRMIRPFYKDRLSK